MDFEPVSIELATAACDIGNLKEQVRLAQSLKTKSRIRARRAKSEAQLAELLPTRFAWG